MSYPSVTHRMVNDHPIDATAVNQNFADIVNALNAGNKDLRMRDATYTGTAQIDANLVVSGNLIDTAGSIGVNTVNPLTALHVDGSCCVTGDLFSYPPTGGWADCSGLYPITGLAPTTTYKYMHRRVGRTNHISFDMTGTMAAPGRVTVGLPSTAGNNGSGYTGSCRHVLDLGSQYTEIPAMLFCPAGAKDMTVSKNFGDATYAVNSLRIHGTFRYEE
jgi:hypothetical protein